MTKARTPREKGTNPRALGTNPRVKGANLRLKGTNPKALGTNPRAYVTAVHEAGHTLANYHLGRLVKKVSIIPGRADGGRVDFTLLTSPGVDDDLDMEAVMIYYAGAVACRLLKCQRGGLSPGDRRELKRYKNRLRENAMNRARNLLSDPSSRAAIRALARELVLRKEMDGTQAFSIIRQFCPIPKGKSIGLSTDQSPGIDPGPS